MTTHPLVMHHDTRARSFDLPAPRSLGDLADAWPTIVTHTLEGLRRTLG